MLPSTPMTPQLKEPTLRYCMPRRKSSIDFAVFQVLKPSISRVGLLPVYWMLSAVPAARSSWAIGPKFRRGRRSVAGGIAPPAGTTVRSSGLPLPGLFCRKTSGSAMTGSLAPL